VIGEDPRFRLIRDAFEAFEARDGEAVIGFLHPDVESRVFPPLLNTGVWQGYDGFLQMTAAWEDAFGEVSYDVRDLEAPDDRHVLAAVHQAATGAESGVPVELDVYFLFELEDGRVVRFQVHATRESALGAL
jgi:ketosteroid isomerase-like protein